MKINLYASWLISAFVVLQSGDVYSQANTALSNLAATSVNQDLLPNAANIRVLGSAARGWRKLYLDSSVYLAGSRFLSYGSSTGLGVTAVGVSVLGPNTGAGNTAVGNSSMTGNTTGGSNTAVGRAALFGNRTGGSNAAFGAFTMEKNSSGDNNSAFGSFALYSNTSGKANVAIGLRALLKNTTGTSSVAIGDSALLNNNNDLHNVAVGGKAMYQNTTGGFNVAVGYQALYSNVTSQSNTATGYQALRSASAGGYNTANGYQALLGNTSGSTNSATGANSLYANTSGASNTANGYSALLNSTTGSYNAGFGKYTLYYNTTQNYNTAVGYSAGDFSVGNNNTFMGAFATPAANGYSNSTALGYNSVFTASNQIMLGNNAITSVKTAGSVVIYSDGRFKKDIEENVPGLDFIDQLRPVTYHYNVHAMNDQMGLAEARKRSRQLNGQSNSGNDEQDDAANRELEEAAINLKEKKLYTGFVAQEVEEAAKKAKFEFSGIYKPQNEKDLYGLSYSDFVVPLVKAVQELSAKNKELVAEIENLKAMIKDPTQTGATLNGASLSQNSPNPVKNNTVINYTVPVKFRIAQLIIYDAYGQAIKQINISASGRGTLNLNTSALAAGEYNYSLLVDGVVVSTRKMILMH